MTAGKRSVRIAAHSTRQETVPASRSAEGAAALAHHMRVPAMLQLFFTDLTQFLPIVFALIAVVISIRTSRLQKEETSYADIDAAYLKVLELAIQYPELRDRERAGRYFELPASDPMRLRYESYAYICMNLMETIFDRMPQLDAQFGISPTWLPVVIEESALHVHWFCRNLRLFKERFQRFIMNELNDLVVSAGTAADLDTIYPRMQGDFPAAELKSRAQIDRLMAGGEYKLYLARHRTIPNVFGYALVFEPKTPKIAWLDYIAIDEHYRNAGFGTAFINKLGEMLKARRRGIMLEVEPPLSDDPETLSFQRRRIAFYNRIGAQQLDAEYLFPGGGEPLPLLLFYFNLAKANVLDKESIRAMIEAAYRYIHDDVRNKEAILARFIGKISDNPLTR
ncbi:MAG TPA: GNAT family N-acetyltransferase [Ktedonobacterales bacterium]